jgi:hypothetical protein
MQEGLQDHDERQVERMKRQPVRPSLSDEEIRRIIEQSWAKPIPPKPRRRRSRTP